MADATSPNNAENALFPNFGAALQIAIFSGGFFGVDTQPCGGLGIWNPTQAGATCGVSGNPLSPVPGDSANTLAITCDGVANNSCTSATSATWSEHKMINWDYGPTYTGPYNAGDLAKLTQVVDSSSPHYMQVDITIRNDHPTMDRPGAMEIPTFYFTNRFRKFYHPSNAGTLPSSPSFTFPTRPGITDSANAVYLVMDTPGGGGSPACYDPGWVTAENTFAVANGAATNPFITIAWFYKGSYLDLANPFTGPCGPANQQSRWHVDISEGRFHDVIKLSNAPRLTLVHGTNYNFRYVIFPYKWDETISTSYGTHTVAETIALMRAAYR